MRELDKVAAMSLDGASGAQSAFFSADSQWIGFFADGKLKKISVRGGAPIVLCDAGGSRGGDWSEDGTIIFPTQFTSPLYRISANGGTPVAATHLDTARSEITHRWPQFLPGGKAVLFTASSDNNFFGRASVDVAPLDTGEPKVLVENAYFGRYLAGGYLAYVSQGTVFVAPFDAKALKVTGTAIPVMQAVNYDISNGSAQFSVSKDGTAVHLDGGTAGQNLNLVLMDRKGNSSVLVTDQPDAAVPRLSPDGKRLAFQQGTGNIWIYDLERKTTSRAMLGTVGASWPQWTPDGQRLTYAHPRSTSNGSGQSIYWERADGSGEEQPLTSEAILNAYPSSWSPDGRILAFQRLSGKDGSCCEIWSLAVDETGKPGEAHEVPGWVGASRRRCRRMATGWPMPRQRAAASRFLWCPFPAREANGKSPPAADSTHAGRRAVTNYSTWMGVRSSRYPTPSRKAHFNRENPSSFSRTVSRCALR